jgi:beta-lactamase regulating signal transducer with metallopeptidase domain
LPLLPLIHFGANAGTASANVAAPTAHALWQLDARWGLAVAGLWVVGSAVRGADLLWHSIRLRRLWKTAQPLAISDDLAAAFKDVRRGNVTICTTEALDRPSVIGFLSPRILIPRWLIGKLTARELEQIVLHETEHLRRNDDWTNLVQKLALVAFPLNLALAWMEHRLCREREMACDDGVVRITNAPRAYAACLASLAERGMERRAEALSLGAWQKRSELVHRVHGILMRKRGMSRTAAGALLAAIGCALLAATVEMARAPELVAFVPKQAALAMTPARQQQLTALLAQESADAKATLPPGFRAVQAKAIVPSVRRTVSVSAAKHEIQSAPAENGAQRHAQQMAKSATGDRVNPEAEQQWVVLAAWEEVHTVNSQNGENLVADFDENSPTAQASDSNSSAEKSKTQSVAAKRYTVTQLILRVVPANQNSNSTQPATRIVREGWLVIQL